MLMYEIKDLEEKEMLQCAFLKTQKPTQH